MVWERRQAELWDRVFQVTHDVVTLAGALEGDRALSVICEDLVRSALAVGIELVRANAADDRAVFQRHVRFARLKAIETDYLLRFVHVVQQRDEVQRDLSSLITQYSAIVDLLERFVRHARNEKDVVARHTRGPRVVD